LRLLTVPHAVLEWDASLREWLATHHAPGLDGLMLLASWIGRRGLVWLFAGVMLVLFRRRYAADMVRMTLGIGLAFLLTDAIVKPLVGRVRPFAAVMNVRVIGERPDTYSFPSGHAASAFAGAFGISRAVPAARAFWWSLAVLIALSRIYVGVHYPLDVLAGAALGLASAWFALGGRVACRDRRTAC
jgi:undecaprenyl-diphosphatase